METLLSLTLVISTVAMFGIQSCSRIPLSDVPVTENVSFEKHIQPITSTVCIKCHTGRGNDFSQYKDAYFKRYRILQRVVVDRTMPAGQFLSDQDRALFRDWVNQGGNQ